VVLVEFGHPITQVRIDVHTPWLGDPTSDGAVSTPHEIEELDDRGLIEMVVVFLADGEALRESGGYLSGDDVYSLA
jgi:hypothetical protein